MYAKLQYDIINKGFDSIDNFVYKFIMTNFIE